MLFGAAMRDFAPMPDAPNRPTSLHAAFAAAREAEGEEHTAQLQACKPKTHDRDALSAFQPPITSLAGQVVAAAPRQRGLASRAPRPQFKPTDKVVAHGASEVTAYLKAFPARFEGGTSAGRCSVAEAAASGATDKCTADIKQKLDDSSPGSQRSEAQQQACVLAEGFLAAACLSTKRVLAQVFAQATADIKKAAEAQMDTCCAQVSMLQVCPGAGDALIIHQMAAVDPSDAEDAPAEEERGSESDEECSQ